MQNILAGSRVVRAVSRVHQDKTCACPGGQLHHAVVQPAGYVIEDRGPLKQGSLRDARIVGIDRNRNAYRPFEQTEHREQTLLLLLRRYGDMSGAGGLGPHVEDSCPLLLNLKRVFQSFFRQKIPSAVGKAVGGHVQNPHNDGPVQIQMSGPMEKRLHRLLLIPLPHI